MSKILGQGDVIMMIASSNKEITNTIQGEKPQIQTMVRHKDSNKNLTSDMKKQGLSGIEQDMNKYKKRFKNQKQSQVFLLRSAKLTELLKKANILNQIGQFFRKGKNKVYLIYTGHGHENGDWKIETYENQDGDRITLRQIIELWEKNKNKQAVLTIYMDSCYSGQWCYRMVQQEIKSLSILASSSYDQQSNTYKQGSLFCRILFGEQADISSNLDLIEKYKQIPKFNIKGESFVSKPTAENYRLARTFVNANNIIGNPIDYESFQWWVDQKPISFVSQNEKGKQIQIIKRKYTEKNGDIYDGQWKKRVKQGQENQKQWVKQGKGIMKYANGQTYDGMWINNVRHGQGTLKFANDQGKPAGLYIGQWQNDLPNGKGIHYYSNDQKYRYDGNWKDSKKQGEGKLFYNDKEVNFKGQQGL